jgi:hypothetical protein
MPDSPSTPEPQNRETAKEFVRRAQEKPPTLAAEFFDFLMHSKKWWLAPIIIVLLLLGLLIFLTGTGAGPFIYPLY